MTTQTNKNTLLRMLAGGFTALSILVAVVALAACDNTSSGGKNPVITQQPKDTTVVEGDNVVVSIQAKNAVGYKLVRGTSDTLQDQVLPGLVLSGVPLSLNGSTYKCVVTGTNGSTVVSNSFTLTVRDSASALYVARAILRDTGTFLFSENCQGCHGELGNGQGHGAPKLANSDFLMNNRTRVITILLRGNRDSLTLNGECRNGGGMAAGGTNDDIKNSNFYIASVLTYLRSVLNDSTVTNCNSLGQCTYTARDTAVMARDTVPVWEVKAVRDTLQDYPENYVPKTCPE